jgi:hypothetical protein
MKEALPKAAATTRWRDLITTTMSAPSGNFSSELRSQLEIRNYSDALTDMFCAYLGFRQRA